MLSKKVVVTAIIAAFVSPAALFSQESRSCPDIHDFQSQASDSASFAETQLRSKMFFFFLSYHRFTKRQIIDQLSTADANHLDYYVEKFDAQVAIVNEIGTAAEEKRCNDIQDMGAVEIAQEVRSVADESNARMADIYLKAFSGLSQDGKIIVMSYLDQISVGTSTGSFDVLGYATACPNDYKAMVARSCMKSSLIRWIDSISKLLTDR